MRSALLKGGRPTNRGIGEFTGYVADFWECQVKRRYTVDYHGGAGLTPAYRFTLAVVAPLDSIPSSQVVTAMRKEIRNRATHINRPKI
jgi:hypothetical protein